MDEIRLVPPPGLVDAATALPHPAPVGDPLARLTAVVAGPAGAFAWALEGPEDGGSWRRPGTVDRLLDHVSRQAHLAGLLIGATARLLRTLVHPVRLNLGAIVALRAARPRRT